MTNRREMLRLMGVHAAALAAAGCVRNVSAGRPYLVDRTGMLRGTRRFVPVDISADRRVRSTVGLRPYRNSGFRVESERLDDKQLIHNYGHGGGGMTLSWGTANLAVRLMRETPPNAAAAVLGAGVVGLTTAILLQRLGYDVTIYAAAAWPHTTSNASAATFYPSHVVSADRVTPPFAAQFESALARGYHAVQRLTGARYGVKWLDSFSLSNGAGAGGPADLETQLQDKVVGQPGRALEAHEHPFAAKRVWQGRDLIMEPMTYLRALLEDVHLAGGKVVIRRFESLRDVAQLPQSIVFNCTGLGSRTLVGDRELRPARGQLCVLPPQPEVDYTLYHGPFYYMVPREDGIILGGTFELDNASTTADARTDATLIGAHQPVFEAMR